MTTSSSRSRAARSGGSFTTRPCTAKVRAASTFLPTLFPSPTGSRLPPSSSRGAIHDMAQTGRSNVRYVDPQRRYTVVLGLSWNAPFGALPHDDRAGTHDSADGRCGSYARIERGQAAMWITSKNFCRSSCQTRHNAVQQNLFLLDHLVGRRLHDQRHRKAERLAVFKLIASSYFVGC